MVGGRGRGREGRGKGRGRGGARQVVCPGARAGSRRAWGKEKKSEGKGRAIKTPLLNALATGLVPDVPSHKSRRSVDIYDRYTPILQPHWALTADHTVCCKGDDANQWRKPKFDPSPRSNPIATVIKVGSGDYVVDPYTCAKVRHDPPRGFVSAHAWLCAPKRVTFFRFSVFLGFLQLATAKAPRSILMQNMPQHAVPCKDVLLRGRDHKI